jgi:hypothetical protein
MFGPWVNVSCINFGNAGQFDKGLAQIFTRLAVARINQQKHLVFIQQKPCS